MPAFLHNFWQWLQSWGQHAAQQAGGAADAVQQAGAQASEQVGPQLSQLAGQLDMPSMLALAAALGWASGFRLYAVVFVTGLIGALGWVVLPGGLHVLQHPAMLVASGALLFVEFFVDKIPGVDSVWDVLHSVIRVPAGAALAASVFGADSATMTTVAALLGGSLAFSSQVAKTTTRAAINTSPEPLSNVSASLVEDGASMGALWLALSHPLVFGAMLAVVLVLMWLVTWMLWRFLRNGWRRLQKFWGDTPEPESRAP